MTGNVALQWFYRILQALALEEDIPDNPEDKTIPRYKQIHKVGSFVIEDKHLSNILFSEQGK
jgi:ATP-dependent DNA helicase 2 subunit 1